MELDIQIATDSVVCRGDSSGQATATVTGGNGPYQFEWNNGRPGDQISDLPAGPVRVTVTDASGCSAQAETEVFEPTSFLEVEAVQTLLGCQGDSGNVVEARIIENPSNTGISFSWSNGSTDRVQTNLAAGTIQLTATDGRGCSATADIQVLDLDTIQFSIQGNPPSCPGEMDGSLGVAIISGGSGTDGADYEYQWNTGDTGPLITGLAGDQVYAVTVTDSVGCQSTEERFLSAPDPISFDLETVDIRCAGEAEGEARFSNINTQDEQFTIRWDPRLNGASGPTIDQLPAGTYSVSLLDGNNCEVDTSFTISEPPALSIELESEDNICFGDSSGTITAMVGGGVPGYQIEWSNGDTSLQIENLVSDFYTLTVTDSNGCIQTETAAISAPSPIELRVETDPPSCNRRDDGSVTVSASGGIGPYLYSFGEESFGTDSLFTGLEPGAYRITVQDAEFCETEEQFIIPEPAEVMVDLGTEVIFINPGDTVVLPAEIITSDGAVDLVWETDKPESLSCTDCLNPLAFPEFTTVYTLRATDQGGCEGFGRIRVQVSKRNLAFVPTGFTPNQDQQNDRLMVHGDPNVQLISFRVFNRWGEQVFENENFEINTESEGWDGTIGGKPAPAGVYLWVLEAEFADGTRQVLDGQTTLIR
jgi:gliding motility-associated-like protein